MTPREREFEELCRAFPAQGIKPTPARVGPEPRHLGGGRWVAGFGNGRTIRGNYVRIRTHLLEREVETPGVLQSLREHFDQSHGTAPGTSRLHPSRQVQTLRRLRDRVSTLGDGFRPSRGRGESH